MGVVSICITVTSLLQLALVATPCAQAATPLQGDKVINTVNVRSATHQPAAATATVTTVIRTPSRIEYLQYAPTLPGATAVQVVPGTFRAGPNPLAPFVPLPLPVMSGSTVPLNLTLPIPLAPVNLLHQGDPVFIRVTDLDQNLERGVVETVFVTVTNTANGDVEVLRLTETGPDTGVFVGYLPTSNLTVTGYDGSLSVREGNVLLTRYVDIVDGSDTSSTAVMVDPFGILFDSVTGQPVNGASITLIDTASGLPATVFGDDGVSSFPATLVSGGSITDSSGRLYTFQPGGYRFPFVLPGSYRFRISPPTGYISPSTVSTTAIQALPGGPYSIVAGSRSEMFAVNPGPVLRIDIPLDPGASSLWLQKSAGKDSAGHGDFIPYQLTLTNNGTTASSGLIRLTDTLPVGFRLRNGSVTVNTVPAADPAISPDGRTLTFSVGSLAAGVASVISYVAEVTAGARGGSAVNSAFAASAGGAVSNTAHATVKVRDDFLMSRSTLMGRVTTGTCDKDTGEGADGVSGIRVYLEDGTFVVSDKRGLFHFEGVRPGLHVVQLDLDSLPDGYQAVSCTENSRFAGRAFSQFVETQGGTLWRTDFHIRPMVEAAAEAVVPKPAASAAQPPVSATRQVTGEAALELSNSIDGRTIVYRAGLRGASLPVENAQLKVILPEGVVYEPGSSRMDGVSIADPSQEDTHLLVYQFGALPDSWTHEVTFRCRPAPVPATSSLTTLAYLVVVKGRDVRIITNPAETSLQLVKDVEVLHFPEVILHPHFPSFGDELDEDDRQRLDELALLLIGLRTETIHVTGHTDDVRITARGRNIHKDNRALSMARARRVGRYLMDRLHLPPEKLTLAGKGESEPVASNRSEAGRALNRRVEVKVASHKLVGRSQLQVLKAFSGEQRAEMKIDLQVESPAVTGIPQPEAAAPVVLSGAIFQAAGSASPSVGARVEAVAAAAGQIVSVPPAPALPIGKAAAPASASVSAAEEPAGFLGRKDGDLLVNRINAVQFKLDSQLTARLLVDGVEVPAKQVGFRRLEPAGGAANYGYIGVDFGSPGEHILTLQGLDPFGNARFERSLKLVRTGEIARIKVRSTEGNVADGKTPVRMQLELYDAAGNQVRADAELELRDGTLKPLVQESGLLEDKVASRRLIMDRDGWVSFQPVAASGPYRVLIGYNTASVEAETYVQPRMRDWILVGLAEGTLGYNTAAGNMESLQGTSLAEELYKDGRIALFAKGQIQGKWLLTMAYDSAKASGKSADGLFQTINPDTFFTLYGDSSQQQYDAASAKKLYLKIEREQFYAMFGDYDTGLTVTELSRYSRRLTGLKTELQEKNYELSAFASETEQAFVRDEIPGDGTSGVYRLSRTKIVPNTEKISIEIRDRFRSEIVVSTRTLGRFTEYSIDYETGAVIFKEPVYSRDQQFNPVTIVAEYETFSSGRQDYTYGGRAGLKLLDQRLKIGGTYIHEGQGNRSGNLYGLDTSFKLGETTRLRAEIATSEYSAGTAGRSGNAYLAEAVHTSRNFDAKAYIREQEAGFGLGQQSGGEAGTRKFGIEGTYRHNEYFSNSATLYRQYNLLNNTRRDVAEGKLNYTDKRYSASVGVLQADDRLADGSNRRSTQLTMGGKVLTLFNRLTLSLDHAQSIGSNGNSDFPTRTTLGAEFAVTKSLTLLAAQEFTWGTGATTQNTRLGLRSALWKGATVTGSVERQFNENDERVFANAGLKQTWQINDAWKVDAGIDRSQTLAKSSHYRFNTGVAPASGSNENFTALSGGATYQVKHLTWDNRLEFRTAPSEEKWGLMSGLVNEVDSRWAWSGRAQLFQTSATAGVDTTRAGLRFGLVYRPPQTRWIVLNRLDYLYDRQNGGTAPGFTSWRLIDNLIANYRPRKDLQISLQYGAKYVRDTVGNRGYVGFTDHTGFESRYDITRSWDIGLRGSLLHSWHSGQFEYSCGPSTGYNLFENIWVGIGYNVWGFEDIDFSSAAYTAQGPYVRFRLKFDQQSVKDAAAWINKQ